MPNLWTSEDVFATLPPCFLFLCGQSQGGHFRRLQEGAALLWRKPAGPWRTSMSPTIRVPPSISVHHLLCIHPCTHAVTACVLTKAHPHLSRERLTSWSALFLQPVQSLKPCQWGSHSTESPTWDSWFIPSTWFTLMSTWVFWKSSAPHNTGFVNWLLLQSGAVNA